MAEGVAAEHPRSYPRGAPKGYVYTGNARAQRQARSVRVCCTRLLHRRTRWDVNRAVEENNLIRSVRYGRNVFEIYSFYGRALRPFSHEIAIGKFVAPRLIFFFYHFSTIASFTIYHVICVYLGMCACIEIFVMHEENFVWKKIHFFLQYLL